MVHPLRVALILAELYADQESIIAGILHDVVEDTPVTLRDVEENFGTEVALLVDGLTKLRKLPKGTGWEGAQKENLRKLFLSSHAAFLMERLVREAVNVANAEGLNFDPDEVLASVKKVLEGPAKVTHPYMRTLKTGRSRRLTRSAVQWSRKPGSWALLYPATSLS